MLRLGNSEPMAKKDQLIGSFIDIQTWSETNTSDCKSSSPMIMNKMNNILYNVLKISIYSLLFCFFFLAIAQCL